MATDTCLTRFEIAADPEPRRALLAVRDHVQALVRAGQHVHVQWLTRRPHVVEETLGFAGQADARTVPHVQVRWYPPNGRIMVATHPWDPATCAASSTWSHFLPRALTMEQLPRLPDSIHRARGTCPGQVVSSAMNVTLVWNERRCVAGLRAKMADFLATDFGGDKATPAQVAARQYVHGGPDAVTVWPNLDDRLKRLTRSELGLVRCTPTGKDPGVVSDDEA
jgi:hypothetical protein